jgi:uncharacterized damage-inducible protein DinB
LNEEGWEEILQNYEEAQTELLEVVDSYTNSKLEAIVPGRKYSFYTLVHGVIHHDIYHSGQMMMLKRLTA